MPGLAVEEAVRQVDLADDHDGLRDEDRGHERGQEADCEQQAADELDQGRDGPEQPGGPEAHVRHAPSQAARPGPPHQPKTFCAPCAANVSPTASWRMKRESSFAFMFVPSPRCVLWQHHLSDTKNATPR